MSLERDSFADLVGQETPKLKAQGRPPERCLVMQDLGEVGEQVELSFSKP